MLWHEIFQILIGKTEQHASLVRKKIKGGRKITEADNVILSRKKDEGKKVNE